MKFIVDAQLPRKLAIFLLNRGIDTIHTLDLPKKNLTSDSNIIEICDNQSRTIITKDFDFYEAKLIKNKPEKLILITIGNSSNKILIELFENYIDKIIELLENYDIVELSLNSIIAK